MGSISAANAEFCFDVFNELKVHHANENILYSPLSIIAALAMVYLGARGNTEYQMEKVSYIKQMQVPFYTVQHSNRSPINIFETSPVAGPAIITFTTGFKLGWKNGIQPFNQTMFGSGTNFSLIIAFHHVGQE